MRQREDSPHERTDEPAAARCRLPRTAADPIPDPSRALPIAPRNGLGMAALVIAIIGLLSCFTIAGGVVLGIAAVVMGFIGQGRVKRGEANNGGVATLEWCWGSCRSWRAWCSSRSTSTSSAKRDSSTSMTA